MVRVLNTLCVALMGLSILALYHVSERTRVATVELGNVNREIAREQADMSVLQTEWERVAGPARIQELAANHLGLSGTPAAQLASFDLLPRRGADPAPLSDTPIRQADEQVTTPPPAPRLQQVADRTGL
jgi:cell division protein FtsL